jgi:SAM-dependent methyltransferase
MLAFARRRQGADAVDWTLGDSRSIPPTQFDVAVLTGNVVQHILDPQWQRTLRDLRAHLRPGGVLAFDSRNPTARAWERWGSQERSRRDTPHGPLVEWAAVSEPDAGIVTAMFHNQFLQTGESVTETMRFAFRQADTLREQLAAAGFEVDAVYGDWARTPFTPDAPFMVFIARAR